MVIPGRRATVKDAHTERVAPGLASLVPSTHQPVFEVDFAKRYGTLNFGPEVALFPEKRPPSSQSGMLVELTKERIYRPEKASTVSREIFVD